MILSLLWDGMTGTSSTDNGYKRDLETENSALKLKKTTKKLIVLFLVAVKCCLGSITAREEEQRGEVELRGRRILPKMK